MSLKTCIGKTRFAGIKPEFAHLRIDVETGNAMEALAEKYQKRTKNPLSQDAAEKAVVQKYLDAAIKERQDLSDQIRELQGMPAPEIKPAQPAQAEQPAKDVALEKARNTLLIYTKNADIYVLAGNASVRAHVMADLMGVDKIAQSKAGVAALRDEFYRRAGITGETSGQKEDNFRAWAQGREAEKKLERVSLDDGRRLELKGEGYNLTWRDVDDKTSPYAGKFLLASPDMRTAIEAAQNREQPSKPADTNYHYSASGTIDNRHDVTPSSDVGLGGVSGETGTLPTSIPRLSRGYGDLPINPHTLSTLTAAIDKAMGNGFTKLLELTGKFKIISSAEIPADVSGMFSKSTDQTTYWHGSVSGDLRGGRTGLHLGTRLAAKQALEASIGVPATGEWDGTREYGKTLLAGADTLDRIQRETNSYPKSGLNAGEAGNPIPKEDYYPRKVLKYADGTDIPMDIKPNILPYRLNTEMTNTPNTAHPDWHANGYMRRQLKQGNAKRGYYYENIAEDSGSISVVVPNGDHVEVRFSADGSRILAFVRNGETFLVADNISQTDDNVKGLLMHEISVHALELGKSSPEFQAILKQFTLMGKMGNQKVKAAQSRVPADTPAHLVEEESLGYYLEKNSDTTFAQKVIAWFKAQVRKLGASIKGSDKLRFFQWASKLSPEDIVSMASQALRSAPQTLAQARDRGTFKADTQYSKTQVFNPNNFKPDEANRENTDQLERTLRRHGHNFTITPVQVPVSPAAKGYTDYKTAEKIASIFNKKVIFIRADGSFNINGVMDTSNPEDIFVDVRSKIPAHVVMGHELSHHMEIESPEIYWEFYDTMTGILRGHEQYRNQRGLDANFTQKEITKEMIGDFMGDSFSDPLFWNLVGKENPGLIRRVANVITKWLNKLVLRSMTKGYGSEQFVTDAKAAKKALSEAVIKYASDSRGITAEDARAIMSPPASAVQKSHGWIMEDENGKQVHGPTASRKELESSYQASGKGNQPAFHITEPLRSKVTSAGMPLFSKAQDIAAPHQPEANTWKSRFDNWLTKSIYTMQDDLIDQKRAQKVSPPKTEASDAYMAYERYPRQVMADKDDFHDDEVTPLIKDIHDSKLDYEEVEQYAWAKHAEEYNATMKERNPTESELETLIDGTDKAKEALKTNPQVVEYKALQKKLRDTKAAVDDGEADSSAIPIIEKRIAEAERNPKVAEFVQLSRKLISLKSATPFVGDNTWLSGMKDEEAQAIIAKAKEDGKAEDLERLSGRLHQITEGTRKLMEKSGLITKAESDGWATLWKNYVPMHRDEVSGDMPRVGQGLNVRGKESKHATGSIKEVTNIIAHVVAQREATIVRAEKVKTDRAFAEYAKENPDANFWELDVAPMKTDINPITGLAMRVVDGLYKQMPNVLTYKVDGIEHTITFNKDNETAMRLAATVKGMSSQQLGEITVNIGKLTRFMALMNTSASPVFAARNFMRDLQTAYLNISGTEIADMKGEVFSNVHNAVRGVWNMARGDLSSEWAKHAREARDAGVMISYKDTYKNIGERAENLKKQLGNMADTPQKNMKRKAFAVWNLVEDVNMAVENGVRLAAYVAARKKGVSQAKAASLATNLTVNFTRHGSKGVEMNMWYMFMNASIQGTATMLQRLQDKRVQKAVGWVVASGFLLDILARSMAGDDDDDGKNDYDQLPGHIKENNWVFWVGGRPVTIPMPYGYNFFNNVGRQISSSMFRKNFSPVQAASELMMTGFQAFSPTGQSGSFTQLVAPTVADPFIQWGENKNFHGGPVHKEQSPYGIQKPEYQMGFKSTSAPAKWLAEAANTLSGGNQVRGGWLDFNPALLDFSVSSIAGGAGRTYLQAFSLPIKEMQGEDIQAREVPFANIFFSAKPEYQIEGDFFKNLKAVQTVEAEIKLYASDREIMTGLQKDHGAELRMVGQAKFAARLLEGIHHQENMIEKQNPPNKKELLKEMAARRQKIQDNFNKRYAEAAQ